jgi:hypothetical protein
METANGEKGKELKEVSKGLFGSGRQAAQSAFQVPYASIKTIETDETQRRVFEAEGTFARHRARALALAVIAAIGNQLGLFQLADSHPEEVGDGLESCGRQLERNEGQSQRAMGQAY